MIGFLLPLFARLGLSQRVSRLLAIGTLILGAAALIGVLWLWLDHREKADDRNNQEIGAAVQREGDLRETLERTETANEAREEIERPGDAGDRLRYDQCLRTARTPANCQRFLPGGQADQR